MNKNLIKRIIIITVVINVIVFVIIGGKITFEKSKEAITKQFAQNFPKIPTSDNFSLFPQGEPACADDYHAQLIYARPKDVESKFKEVAPKLRVYFKSADGIVNDEAKKFKTSARLKVFCEKGEISVSEVVLPSTEGYYFGVSSGTRDVLVSDLRQLGYNKRNSKYIVLYDGRGAGCSEALASLPCVAQQSQKIPDDRLSEDNASNFGPDFVLLYKVEDSDIKRLVAGGFNTTYDMLAPILLLHEYGHAMGAVQPSAPHITKKERDPAHCIDSPTIGQGGTDIMCRSESQSEVFGNACSGFYPFHFDCNNDDYFNPKPEPGSYLATHWNLGSPLNHFIKFGNL